MSVGGCVHGVYLKRMAEVMEAPAEGAWSWGWRGFERGKTGIQRQQNWECGGASAKTGALRSALELLGARPQSLSQKWEREPRVIRAVQG